MTFVLIFLIVLLAACVVQWLAADCWDLKNFFIRARLGYRICVVRGRVDRLRRVFPRMVERRRGGGARRSRRISAFEKMFFP